jgi:hypothetical protein
MVTEGERNFMSIELFVCRLKKLLQCFTHIRQRRLPASAKSRSSISVEVNDRFAGFKLFLTQHDPFILMTC